MFTRRIVTENVVSSPLQMHESSVFGDRVTMNEAVDSRPLYTETMSVESWEIEKKILAEQNISWDSRSKFLFVSEKQMKSERLPSSSSIAYETVLDQSLAQGKTETAVLDTIGGHFESEVLQSGRGTIETSVNDKRSSSLPDAKTRIVSPFETMKSDLVPSLSVHPITRKSLPIKANSVPQPNQSGTGQSSNITKPTKLPAVPSNNDQKLHVAPPPLPPRGASEPKTENKAIWVTEAQRKYFNSLSESELPNEGRPPTVSPPPPTPPRAQSTEGQTPFPGPNVGRPPEKANPYVEPFPPPPPPSYPSTFNPDPISNKPLHRTSFPTDPPPQYVPHSKPQTYQPAPTPPPTTSTQKDSALDLPFVTRNCRYRRPRFGVCRPGEVFWRPSLDSVLGGLIHGVDATLQVDICNDCFEGWKNDNPYRSPVPGSWIKRKRNGQFSPDSRDYILTMNRASCIL